MTDGLCRQARGWGQADSAALQWHGAPCRDRHSGDRTRVRGGAAPWRPTRGVRKVQESPGGGTSVHRGGRPEAQSRGQTAEWMLKAPVSLLEGVESWSLNKDWQPQGEPASRAIPSAGAAGGGWGPLTTGGGRQGRGGGVSPRSGTSLEALCRAPRPARPRTPGWLEARETREDAGASAPPRRLVHAGL